MNKLNRMLFSKTWIDLIGEQFVSFPSQKLPIIPEEFLVGKINPSARRASVFVPLCNRHGVASVLLTVRSNLVSTHKGQVAFPGGHIDTGETEVEAAFRECYEELGPSIGSLRYLGSGQEIPAVTGTLVRFSLIASLYFV